MTPNESVNIRAIVDYLKSLGCWYINVKGSVYAIGVPDILAVLPPKGTMLAVEVKRPKGGRTRQLQRVTLDKIGRAGGIAVLATSVNDVRKVIESHSN